MRKTARARSPEKTRQSNSGRILQFAAEDGKIMDEKIRR
jgi:hypothetical protein